jgi:hypothetical protein
MMHLVWGSFQNKFICLFSINKIIKIKIIILINFQIKRKKKREEKQPQRILSADDYVLMTGHVQILNAPPAKRSSISSSPCLDFRGVLEKVTSHEPGWSDHRWYSQTSSIGQEGPFLTRTQLRPIYIYFFVIRSVRASLHPSQLNPGSTEHPASPVSR